MELNCKHCINFYCEEEIDDFMNDRFYIPYCKKYNQQLFTSMTGMITGTINPCEQCKNDFEKEMQNTNARNILENIPKEKIFHKTCENCKHYIGGGDFELCCTKFPELYYEDTPSCNSWEGNVDKLIEIIEILQGERF